MTISNASDKSRSVKTPSLSFTVVKSKYLSGLTDQENWLYHTLVSMGDALIATDTEGKVLFMNPLAEELTGWTLAEAAGQDVAAVYQAVAETSGEAVQRLLIDIARGEDVLAVKVDMELVARDGTHFPIEDTAAPIKNAVGETTGVVVVFHDSGEERDARRKVEEFNLRLRQAMAETNHRVKNNLQVVAALVDLHAEEGEDSISTGAKKKLGMHVRTLAHLHEFLTEEAKTGEGVTYVSALDTLAKLVPMVQATVAHRLLSFTGESIRLPTRQSSSLALIVNELISNALKHGKGSVEIILAEDNGDATVEILDDGAGFPAGFDAGSAAHNGLELVESLVRIDLSGQIEYGTRPEGGGRVFVRFPIQ